MENALEEIKRKVDIVEFIGGYIQVKKAGRNFKANCPFHQEKSPSFVISPDRQIWHCFGACGDGGDVVKFLMKWENITFYEALKELAHRYGIQLQKIDFEDKEWNQKDKLLRINTLANEYYQYILHSTTLGKKAMEYLLSRGLNTQIIKTFNLGYSPDSWDSLLKFLKKKQFSEADLVEAGVVVKNDTRGTCYDRFRGRLMFPIKDIRGNIIAFSGRLIEKGDDSAKYVNTPETPIYHKRESLFGIHLAADSIRKIGNVLLVEGEFDMITPYQHGISNVVAIKGSAVTKEQLTILKRLTTKITLALDSDAAGQEAMKRGIEEAERMEFDIHIVQFSEGKDPDEAVKNNLVAFKKEMEAPLPVYDFLINTAQKKYPNNDPFDKKKISDDIIPFVAGIRNPIVQSYYVKKLAHILEVSEESVQSALKKHYKLRYQKPFSSRLPQSAPGNRSEMLEKYIMSLLLQAETANDIYTKIVGLLEDDDFNQPSYQKIYKQAVAYRTNNPGGYQPQDFLKQLPAELQSVADQLFMYNSSSEEMKEFNLERTLYEIKRFSLKKKISKGLAQENGENEENGDLARYSQQLNEVEKKMAAL
jgi:DNA primase